MIEIVVVIAVLSILSFLTIGYIARTADLYAIAGRQREADAECDLAYTRVQREFRLLQTLSAATDNSVSFVGFGSVTKTIAFTSGSLTLNGNHLARGVTNFTLSYYDSTNGPLSGLPLSAADRARVRRIELAMAVMKGPQASVLRVNFCIPEAGIIK